MDDFPKTSSLQSSTSLNLNRLAGIFLIIANVSLIMVWMMNTPPGLLGKADAAGYAVCHRIDTRSFFIGDRQMPLCARCSGMYLGALLGILYSTRFGKRSVLPPLKISLVLIFFLLAFAVDGSNSYLHLFPNLPGIYEPNNILRLLTGTGVGLGIAAILVPVFNQVAWRDTTNQPILTGWRTFLPLLGLAVLLDLAILSDIPAILFPLALLSGLSILLVLVMVYTVVWMMILKRENMFSRLWDLRILALAGLFTAMMQIAMLDAGRFWLTGTWAGFQF